MRRFAVGLLLAAGCGPGFQLIYEADARFEHCYALDETSTASMSQKAECWQAWSKSPLDGQTRERVDYAKARYNALVKAPAAPTDEALMEAAPGVVDTSAQLAAPTPTSAFAPPPVMAGSSAPPSKIGLPPAYAPAPPEAPARVPPGAACVEACAAHWRSCGSKTGCDADYSRCLGRCVKR